VNTASRRDRRFDIARSLSGGGRPSTPFVLLSVARQTQLSEC
jgi:hypothetical protein